MNSNDAIPAVDALRAMLIRSGTPPELASEAAGQLLSLVEPSESTDGNRYLVLMNHQFVAEEREGRLWISREAFARVLEESGSGE